MAWCEADRHVLENWDEWEGSNNLGEAITSALHHIEELEEMAVKYGLVESSGSEAWRDIANKLIVRVAKLENDAEEFKEIQKVNESYFGSEWRQVTGNLIGRVAMNEHDIEQLVRGLRKLGQGIELGDDE